MDELRNFLDKARVREKGKPYNLLNLCGGKYNILPEVKDEFLDLMESAIPLRNSRDRLSLSFVPPLDDRQPIRFDIDLRYSEKPSHDYQMFMNFGAALAEQVAQVSEGDLDWVIVAKPRPYKKKKVWKSGFHVYFPDTSISLLDSVRIRNASLDLVDEILTEGHINSNEDVLDECVVTRKNGLMMAGCYKPGTDTGGRYNVICYGCYQGGQHQASLVGEQWWEDVPLRVLYGFAFEKERIPLVPLKPPTKTRKIIFSTPTKFEPKYSFRLEKFLEATKGWVPQLKDYNNLCMFMANSDVEERRAEELCNRAWNPPGSKSRETSRFIAKYRGNSDVGPWVVKTILEKHSSSLFDIDQILPREKFKFYDQYRTFLHKISTLEEIEQFVIDVINFVSSNCIFCWWRTEKEVDLEGNPYELQYLELSKKAPWRVGSDDVSLKVYPSELKIKEALREYTDNNKSKGREQLFQKILRLLTPDCRLKGKELYLAAEELIGEYVPKIELMRLGKVVDNLQLNHKLRRYQNLKFKPYFGTTPTTHSHTLNIFTPFHLLHYAPKRNVDVRNTKVWEYLWHVLSWEKEDLFEYWLDVLSDTILNCAVKKDRLSVLRSKGQGTGKSCLCKLFEGLLGSRYVTFFCSMDRVFSRFNAASCGKLILWVDDVAASTKSETQKLFALATAHKTTMENKGEKPVTLDEFSSLWITSNFKQALYCTSEDRRQQVFEASEARKRNKEFFTQLHREFRSMDVMKAWFDFLTSREISNNFHPKHSNPPSSARDETIHACMPMCHKFVYEFFLPADWPFRYYGPSSLGQGNVEVKSFQRGELKGKVVFRICRKSLYHVFKQWSKTNYPNSRQLSVETFQEQLKDCGLKATGKRVPLRRNSETLATMVCFDVNRERVEHFLKLMYPGKVLEPWECLSQLQEFKERIDKVPY